MKIELDVELKKGVNGADLMEAVHTIAGNEFHQERKGFDALGEVFLVGRSSGYPYADLVIKADGDTSISERIVYRQISVCFHRLPGMKFNIGYYDVSVFNAIQHFRDELQKLLT